MVVSEKFSNILQKSGKIRKFSRKKIAKNLPNLRLERCWEPRLLLRARRGAFSFAFPWGLVRRGDRVLLRPLPSP